MVIRGAPRSKRGLLLVNLGTPEAPTTSAVRRYLKQFLSDPRVVEFSPRLIWWLILNLVILRIRPSRSAKLYQQIWQAEGSPLLVYSQQQAAKLQQALPDHQINLAMCYGNPSIAAGMNELKQQDITDITILPLYPQYSCSTTAAVFDAVSKELRHWRQIPKLSFINHYHNHPSYIDALANSIEESWQQHGRGEQLIISFHGTPESYQQRGDPYRAQCERTTELLVNRLGLEQHQWQLVFQSRMGREPWLQPYCDKTLQQLPRQQITSVDVICPGFSADCLETLEEISKTNQTIFLKAGGKRYHYIPALNAREDHISCLKAIITESS